jgi:hypothetical protein
MPIEQFEEGWGPAGRYRMRGPIVQVTGVFRYHDEATFGETFVDATTVTLLDPARETPGEQNLATWVVGFVLAAAGAGTWRFARVRNRNRGMF